MFCIIFGNKVLFFILDSFGIYCEVLVEFEVMEIFIYFLSVNNIDMSYYFWFDGILYVLRIFI